MSVNILGKEYDIATTTTLDLCYKSLTEIPESIGSLYNLQELHLHNNNLISLSESIGSLSNLQKLYLDNNNLTELPKSIGSLSNLQELQLEYNNLTILPESIGSLSNLKYLSLSYNNLTSLPESIQSLSNLKYLSLEKNKLTSLWVDKKSETFSIHDASESIGSLSNLQYLDLSYNKLTRLPKSIKTLIETNYFGLDESSYDINNLSMDCHTLVLTSIENNITNLPPILRTLYLKSDINVDMIKIPYGCDIIRF